MHVSPHATVQGKHGRKHTRIVLESVIACNRSVEFRSDGTPVFLDTQQGASEHVAKQSASWTRRLVRSVAHHKNHPQTEEARTRSVATYGTHGSCMGASVGH